MDAVSATGTECRRRPGQSFTVTNDSTWYEYTVTATNLAGESPESPQSTPRAGRRAAGRAGDLSAATTTGLNGRLQRHHLGHLHGARGELGQQISHVEYGDQRRRDRSRLMDRHHGRPRQSPSTSAMTSQIANGTAVVVYLRACNDAGLCGSWAGPTAQVTPYAPPGPPSVTRRERHLDHLHLERGGATASPATLNVCINGGCMQRTPAPAAPRPSYGYSQTQGTITAYLTDTAGQRAPATARSAPPPPPRRPTRRCPSARAAPGPIAGCGTCTPELQVGDRHRRQLPRELDRELHLQSSNSGSF